MKQLLYYVSAVYPGETEEACDFGFDMVERILLDECFKSIRKIPAGFVKEKRFCLYEKIPVTCKSEILGLYAAEISNKYGIYLGIDRCHAVVVNRENLEVLLLKLWVKVNNLQKWKCSTGMRKYGMFDSPLTFDPYIMRCMLSEEKYGAWEHGKDRERTLQVLDKFIIFLKKHNNIKDIILYSEIFCSRWDSRGEIRFDNRGRALGFRHFAKGTACSYLYSPKVEVWERV